MGYYPGALVCNTLCRWLAKEGIKVGSEKEQRKLSKTLITTDIVSEMAPFTHAIKQGGEEVKPGAIAYVPVLKDKLFELLDQHAR